MRPTSMSRAAAGSHQARGVPCPCCGGVFPIGLSSWLHYRARPEARRAQAGKARVACPSCGGPNELGGGQAVDVNLRKESLLAGLLLVPIRTPGSAAAGGVAPGRRYVALLAGTRGVCGASGVRFTKPAAGTQRQRLSGPAGQRWCRYRTSRAPSGKPGGDHSSANGAHAIAVNDKLVVPRPVCKTSVSGGSP